MKTTAEHSVVINAFTQAHDWVSAVRSAMKQRAEIVLILRPARDITQDELLQLCREHRYSAPANVPPERWAEYKSKLQLSDLAAKEQSITPEMVHVLHPL